MNYHVFALPLNDMSNKSDHMSIDCSRLYRAAEAMIKGRHTTHNVQWSHKREENAERKGEGLYLAIPFVSSSIQAIPQI
jgi:hypothetical protein